MKVKCVVDYVIELNDGEYGALISALTIASTYSRSPYEAMAYADLRNDLSSMEKS